MESLRKIAKWNSRRNPLEHILGKNSITPTLLARGQDNNAQMILICEDFDEETDIRWLFLE